MGTSHKKDPGQSHSLKDITFKKSNFLIKWGIKKMLPINRIGSEYSKYFSVFLDTLIFFILSPLNGNEKLY